jgi:hypothetical protein
MDGRFIIGVSAENRAGAKVAGGDAVDVDIELDTAPRVMKLPKDSAAALQKEPKAKKTFDSLSYSNQNGSSGVVYGFAGSARAYVPPRVTHFASWRLVRRSSEATRSQPCISRPRISIGRALVVATILSDRAGSTRTKAPP